MSRHLSGAAPPRATVAAIAGVALAAWLAFLAGAAQGIGTAERDALFSPSVPVWTQSMLPARDTPFATPWSPSSALGRASIAVALGRRTALRDFGAATSAAAVAAFGVWLIRSGVPRFPALLTMLAMAAGATFWERGVSWMPDALSPLLALIAAWAGGRWSITPRPALAATAILAAALALAEDPAWLACIPAVALWLWHRAPSDRLRRVALGGLAAAAACAALPVAATAAVGHRLPWATWLGIQPPGVAALWRHAATGAPPASLGELTSTLFREFTPLGTLLVMAGFVILWRLCKERSAVAALVAGLIAWSWLVPSSGTWLPMPFTVCGWAAAAVALAWLRQSVSPRAGLSLATILALLMMGEPALTRARLAELGQYDLSEARATLAYGFKVSDLPPNTAIVAESRRVDAALLLSSQMAGHPALIVPHAVELVQAMAERGGPVVAFPGARAHLDRFGFLFERTWVGTAEMATLAGRVPCAPLTPGAWTDVSLLVATGSFILHAASPGAAPGGAHLRLADPQPVRAASIEPRSIPFELNPTVRDAAAGIPELDKAVAGRGQWPISTLVIRDTGRPSPVTFTFAAPPAFAVARAEGIDAVSLCPGPTRGLTMTGDAKTAALGMTDTWTFGPGWHSPEADPDPFRWTAATDAAIQIRLAKPTALRVTITAAPAARPAQQPTIALAVNTCQAPAQPMPPGQGDSAWDVSEACWRPGINRLWVTTRPLVAPASLTGSHDTRLLGARVGAIRLARIEGLSPLTSDLSLQKAK